MPNVRRMGYFLTLLIGTALAVSSLWKPVPPTRFTGITGDQVPRALDGYRAEQDDPVPPDVKEALASADLLSRTYRLSEDRINLVLIGGTDRSALHDPRSCLIGAGMQLENDHLTPLPGTGITARSCRAVGQPGAPGYDILYLYLVNGKIVNQVTQIRAAMLLSALLGRRGVPVYFLRFSRELNADPQIEAQGHAHLIHFAMDMWTRLQPRLVSATG